MTKPSAFSILAEVWLDNYNVEYKVRFCDDMVEEVLVLADPPRQDAVVRFKRESRIPAFLQGEIGGALLFSYYGLEDALETDDQY